MSEDVTYYNHEGCEYDTRHGGPYDRGSADYYYWRECKPHYYKGDTYSTDKVEEEDMNQQEIKAYQAGYENETDRKDYT
jgi:hypothetical protein